jgi:hypothetical protein
VRKLAWVGQNLLPPAILLPVEEIFMSEEPKNIWKKSWTGWRGWLLGWLVLMGILCAGFFILLLATGTRIAKSEDELRVFAAIAIVVTLIFLLVTFVRWLCCWRNFKRFLFGLAGLAMLIVLGYAEENWRGKHDWEKFKHDWEAKGEHFDTASVRPAPVPEEQNFAMAPIFVESVKATLGPKNSREWFGNNYAENGRTNFTDRLALNTYRNNDWAGSPTNGQWAKATLTDLAGWQAYYRAPVDTSRNPKATNEFPVAAQMQTPAQDVLLALSKYDPAIEELRQASRLPYARFPVGYDIEDPAEILLPHLALVKRSSQVLQLRAIAELQNGESEKALADIKLTLRLADAIRNEPFLISHLVRIAILQITMQPIYEGLAQHKWSEAQLVDLDATLAKADFLADYKLAMRGEMVFQGGIFDYLRHHPEQLMNLSGDFGGDKTLPFPARMVWKMIPTGWFYQNQIGCARPMVEFYLPAADLEQRTISPAKIRDASTAIEAATKRTTPYNVIERMLLPALGNAVKKFAYAQATVNLARTAIALERCRLAHGKFPETLDALAPQFIAQLPNDVIGGQPLKYRRTADGQFILYAVGWNETDDGGVVVFKKGETPSVDISQGDWVWRYPQKE